LTSTFNDPAEILDDFTNPPEGNLSDVYRLRLGLPHVAAEDKLNTAQVFACCNNEVMPRTHHGPCAMGVDVGKTKHVVIGTRTGKDQYEVVKVFRTSEGPRGWAEIHDAARSYNVRSAVIDCRPYEDEARVFQAQERYRIALCEYSESTTLGTQFNDKTGMVRVNRTEAFDATHRLVTTPGRLTIPRICPEIKEFAVEMCNTAKRYVKNKQTGRGVYRYKAVGPDHYRNALNYFVLAARRTRLAVCRPVWSSPAKLLTQYSRA